MALLPLSQVVSQSRIDDERHLLDEVKGSATMRLQCSALRQVTFCQTLCVRDIPRWARGPKRRKRPIALRDSTQQRREQWVSGG